MPAGSVNDTDPVTRPVALTGVTADHPRATGGATTTTETVAAAPGTERTNGAAPATTGAAATNAEAPLPIARDPNNPASRSRKIPTASTLNASNACVGPVGAFNPNNVNARATTPRNGAITGTAVNTGALIADTGRATGTCDAAALTVLRESATAGTELPAAPTSVLAPATGAEGSTTAGARAAPTCPVATAGAGTDTAPVTGLTRTGLAGDGLPAEAAAPGSNDPDRTPAPTTASIPAGTRAPSAPRTEPTGSEPPW